MYIGCIRSQLPAVAAVDSAKVTTTPTVPVVGNITKTGENILCFVV